MPVTPKTAREMIRWTDSGRRSHRDGPERQRDQDCHPAEPDVGIMRRHIEGWELCFADGTMDPHSVAQGSRASREEHEKVQEALDEALARG